MIIAILLFTSVKIVSQYERGIIFRFGRHVKTVDPGILFTIPIIDRMLKVDMRIITMDLASQEAVTKDNIVVRLHIVTCFKVVDPAVAVVNALDHDRATAQIIRATLMDVLAGYELDELLAQREGLGQKLQQAIDEQTRSWGVQVSVVEIRDVELADRPGEKYRCNICGNEATLTKVGNGSFACCGQEMVKVT